MATAQTAANDINEKLPLRVSFRTAARQQVQSLARVFANAFGEFNEFESAEKYMDYARHSQNHSLIVANANGKAAGLVMANTQSFKRHSLYIEQLAVAPDMQGRGIGTGLLKQAETLARKKGFNAVALRVRKDNDKAIALYTRLGFKKAGTDWWFYRDKTTAVRMVKELPDRKKPQNDNKNASFGSYFKNMLRRAPAP